ncbi:MAG: hypothetical protein NC237_04430 [Eubacterium sp.]|nr:hypothetical protein [Eubacterium sp.]MCM1419291.1 hypothetical protein [Roseburia sp.]
MIAEQHGECQFCAMRGRYARAELVHHVKPLKRFPSLAYAKTYVDQYGRSHRQLVALCRACHEEAHGRAPGSSGARVSDERRGFRNDERW